MGVWIKETKGKTVHELQSLYLPKGRVSKEIEQVKEVEMAAAASEVPAAASEGPAVTK